MTYQLYAVIFDPQGYHTLKALCKTENQAIHCARILEEVVGAYCDIVPWEV